MEYKFLLPIPSYENKYSITETGNIYSHPRKGSDGRVIHGCWLKPAYDKDGYKRVSLSNGGRNNQKNLRVCRLVALTYLPIDPSRPFVNHINGIKTDDSIENLEWVSAKENTQHAWKLGLCQPYDRKQPYNKQGIILSNKRRRKAVFN